MFEKALERPSDYFKLDVKRQWEIDKELGILDWEGFDKLREPEKWKRWNLHFH